MARYGRLDWTVLDTSGNAKANATVVVRRPGAYVNANQAGGASPQTFNVDDIGEIETDAVVEVYASDGTTKRTSSGGSSTFTATAVAATTVTLSGYSGTLALTDDDRITVVTPGSATLTLYNDAQGTEALASTTLAVTSATGRTGCYALARNYDLLVSHADLTTTLYPDVPVHGEFMVSDLYSGLATTPAVIIGSFRTLGLNDELLAVVNNVQTLETGGAYTNSFRVYGTGKWRSANSGTIDTGGLTVTAGGVTVTGNSTITGTLGGLTGLTVASGSVSVPAGSIATAALAASSITDAETEITNVTDDTVTGTTHVLIGTTSGDDFTVTITPNSSTSVYLCILQCSPSLVTGGAAVQGSLRIQNTTAGTTIASTKTYRQDKINDGTAGERIPITLIGLTTGITGANTIQGQMAGGDGTQVIHLNGDEVTARFMVIEWKK